MINLPKGSIHFWPIVYVDPKWHFNMYLGKFFTCLCIVLHISGVYAHYVFDEMPKWHFIVVLNSDEYQTLGITMIMHVYHVLIFGRVFYTLFPMQALSCLDHASHMHTTCTLDAHTWSLDMFCTSLMLNEYFYMFSTWKMIRWHYILCFYVLFRTFVVYGLTWD